MWRNCYNLWTMLHQNRHVMYNHHIIRMHIAYLFIVYNKYEIILSPRPRSNSFHDPGTLSLAISSQLLHTTQHRVSPNDTCHFEFTQIHTRNHKTRVEFTRDVATPPETRLIQFPPGDSLSLCLQCAVPCVLIFSVFPEEFRLRDDTC